MTETSSQSQLPSKTKSKTHTKSDASLKVLNINEKEAITKETLPHELKKLKKEKEKMAKCLEDAMEKNKKLRNELIRKRELQKKLEDAKNTTQELETLVKICKPDDKNNSEDSK